ncbi:MAG: glycosyltransferase family 4 protein [Candidatus Aenigmatarchaeota archaeon]
MDLLLVVPSFNVEKFKGLARYSLELYKRIKNKIDVEVYQVYEPKKDYLANLSKVPLKQLLSKAKVIHSTVPESGAFLGYISKLRSKKTIVTFHDLIPLKDAVKLKFRFQEFIKLYTTFMWKNATKSNIVVAQSSQTAQEVEKVFKRKVDYIIPPGVDKKFKPKKVKKEKITLGFFANFSYRKGLDKAIEVFKIVKKKYDVKLIIAGGELQTLYQRQFNVYELTKGLKDVEIVGYVPEEKIVDLYNSFDFYLFPSISEGFGIPILEAQACGIPTLVFEWARIPKEVIEKAIKCKDVNDMAKKIMHLIENKEEYEKIRREGMKYSKKFDWDKSAKKYLDIYLEQI